LAQAILADARCCSPSFSKQRPQPIIFVPKHPLNAWHITAVVVVAVAGHSKVQEAPQVRVVLVAVVVVPLGALPAKVAHPLLQVMAAAGPPQTLVRHTPVVGTAGDHQEAVVVARHRLIHLDSGLLVATEALAVEAMVGHQALGLRMAVVECKARVVEEVGMVGQHHLQRLAMYLSRSLRRCSRLSTGVMVADLSWTYHQ